MEKVGKSTFGAQLPHSLFCNFEIGTNFLPGVKAQPITKWSDFKLILKQLEKPEAMAMYDTIVIDTVGQAYTLCEEFICSQAAVQSIGDIPYGGGYISTKKEFESALRKITMLGYGILIIAHSQTKNVKVDEDTTVEKVSPAIPTRAADIVNRLVDIIAYIDVQYDKNENGIRTLVTRGTPTILAGSRLPYLESRIPFSYNDLVSAIGDAIEKQVENDGAVVVDTAKVAEVEILDFKALRAEANELWNKLVKDNESEEAGQENANIILKKIEIIMGRKMRLSELTEDQVDLLNLIVIEMREMIQ